ncbi:LacI family DNA-binding transcriptional regulator [Sphingobacterium paludis]|uniref:LacI family transcriptional regulator n=1 Tax=Sphingobacterium paludis TaxID=1476465 RepID=A0A4R7CZK8_9SPHI|nr:LacI family DNA-binding transcriptional regulator [Sphingobacterium paludis]TDS13201.1 LacI family transcriptional regulator [Sphingobacterium paludis]
MSISEIAKHLNVSKSTVSLVINGKAEEGRISKASAQRIRDYIEEIGYKPNALAKSLATGKSRTIGLVVENIGDSFFGPIALHIEEYLRKHEYQVLYSSTMGDNKLAAEIVQTMLDKQVDGIILAPTDAMGAEVERMLKNNLPLVLFDRKIPNLQTNYVGTDNYEASRQAVEHLLQQGYKNIGMVTIDSQQPQMQDRLRAYRDVLAENRLEEQLLYTSFLDRRGNPVKAITTWLRKNPQIDGLFFSTNYVCVAGLKAIRTLDREHVLGLITFDDLEMLELMRPQISCIRQPLEKIAKAIVHMLIEQLNDSGKSFDEKIIKSSIQIRESSL